MAVRDAWKKQFNGAFLALLNSLVKAEDTEEEYASFAPAVRQLTRKQFRLVAERASSYYVDHANPTPGDLSRAQSRSLFKKALESALRGLEAEQK